MTKSKGKAQTAPKSDAKAKSTNPKDMLNQFKTEAAAEMGVTLKEGYNGDLTAKEAGSIGGQMVKKLIERAEQQ